MSAPCPVERLRLPPSLRGSDAPRPSSSPCHLGRSLGMWIKLPDLAQYRARYPFRMLGYDGEWYRRLP